MPSTMFRMDALSAALTWTGSLPNEEKSHLRPAPVASVSGASSMLGAAGSGSERLAKNFAKVTSADLVHFLSLGPRFEPGSMFFFSAAIFLSTRS